MPAVCAGALLPFTSREDVDFFSHLEMHLRQDHPPLAGRDHMAYRSAYFPVRSAFAQACVFSCSHATKLANRCSKLLGCRTWQR